MKTNKTTYECPTCDQLVVRFQGVVCVSFDPDNNTETFVVDEDEDL